MKKINYKYEKGFTLIETIISILIFSIIVISIASIFARIVFLQKRAVAAQKIQENSLFVLEAIAREIRVSQIISPEDSNCSTSSLSINHPDKGAINYSISNGAITRNGDALSSSDVVFSRFNFCIVGSSPGDNFQPKITIVTSVQDKTGNILTVDMQTTVTSRDTRDEL